MKLGSIERYRRRLYFLELLSNDGASVLCLFLSFSFSFSFSLLLFINPISDRIVWLDSRRFLFVSLRQHLSCLSGSFVFKLANAQFPAYLVRQCYWGMAYSIARCQTVTRFTAYVTGALSCHPSSFIRFSCVWFSPPVLMIRIGRNAPQIDSPAEFKFQFN